MKQKNYLYLLDSRVCGNDKCIMVSEELVALVAENLKQGESREKIQEYLVSQGLTAEEIDGVFASVPKEPSFWEQLPIYPHFAALDAKTAQLPARVVLGIAGGLVVLVLLFGAIMYFFMNPTGKAEDMRDRQREADYAVLREGLSRYFADSGDYPSRLEELVPSYLSSMPRDPETGKLYGYAVSGSGTVYSLCVYFETKSPSEGCVSMGSLKIEEFVGPEVTGSP